MAKPTGSVQAYPRTQDMVAFRIPHGVAVKLDVGTWHAGQASQQTPWRPVPGTNLASAGVTSSRQHSFAWHRLHQAAVCAVLQLPDRCCTPIVAGPLFRAPDTIDFYNLELSDTNIVDHNAHDYHKSNGGREFEVVDAEA